VERERRRRPNGGKEGLEGEGEYGGRKRKVRRGKNVVRHLIETKFVGKQNSLVGR
jgi:hypothetical protein